jgi:hypothetical protein
MMSPPTGEAISVEKPSRCAALSFPKLIESHRTARLSAEDVRITPATATGVTDRLWETGNSVKVLEDTSRNFRI